MHMGGTEKTSFAKKKTKRGVSETKKVKEGNGRA